MCYQLVDLRSGRRIGDYDAEEALLGDVRYMVSLRGPAAIAGIGFGRVDARGRATILAKGRALVELAERTAP